MGNCEFKSDKRSEPIQSINPASFMFIEVIGKGGFGKVWKVSYKKNKIRYAMKEMSKAVIISKRSVNSIMNERKLLAQLRHSFIVNMHYAFQDRDKLYLVLDYCDGGDLRFHIGRQKQFTEEQAKFFIACIIMGLEYVHLNGILHRDIKPENIVMDKEGYLHITDFGVARIWNPENSQDTSGTPGYMAPEVLCRQNHGIAVDYYALGIITYELMLVKRPYNGKNRKDIREQILSRQVLVTPTETSWSHEAIDLINLLIQRKPVNRLGLNGSKDVKNHPWFQDFNWEQLRRREMQAPYKPDPADCIDLSHKRRDEELSNADMMVMKQKQIQDLFVGYFYDISKNNETSPTSLQSSFIASSNA